MFYELQLFVQFGHCLFRNNCFALKDKVFAPLSLSGGKRPIIFMTATATTTILEQTSLLTGLTFCLCNIGPAQMPIEFVMTLPPFSVLTSLVDKLYQVMDGGAVRH
jgi:hypothetical protein